MHGLYAASDEDNADYPNFLRKAEKKLAKAQKKLSKRQEGSRNHDKQRTRVAILHEKIANQRLDFLHKKARYLADKYDAIGIEDISVKAMAKRKKGEKFSFGKSVAVRRAFTGADNNNVHKVAAQEKKILFKNYFITKKIPLWRRCVIYCHKGILFNKV